MTSGTAQLTPRSRVNPLPKRRREPTAPVPATQRSVSTRWPGMPGTDGPPNPGLSTQCWQPARLQSAGGESRMEAGDVMVIRGELVVVLPHVQNDRGLRRAIGPCCGVAQPH